MRIVILALAVIWLPMLCLIFSVGNLTTSSIAPESNSKSVNEKNKVVDNFVGLLLGAMIVTRISSAALTLEGKEMRNLAGNLISSLYLISRSTERQFSPEIGVRADAGIFTLLAR